MDDKTRWYAEFALDVVATIVLGWFVVGAIVGAILVPMVVDPKDPGELAKAIPILAQIGVTYAMWKLFRSFNWLKGTPPAGG